MARKGEGRTLKSALRDRVTTAGRKDKSRFNKLEFLGDNRLKRVASNNRKIALKGLNEDLGRLKRQNTFTFERLENVLQLVRKQRKRYTDLVEGKTPLYAKDGTAFDYQFVCGTCGSKFNAFHKLQNHCHTPRPTKSMGKSKPGKFGISETRTGKTHAIETGKPQPDDESSDDYVLDMDFDDLSLWTKNMGITQFRYD